MNLDEIFIFIGKMSPGIALIVILFAYNRILERKGK